MPGINDVNFVAGVSVFTADVEELVRASERLNIIRNYVLSSSYIDKTTLLALLGESSNEGVKL